MNLLKKIHEKNPYDNFDCSGMKLDLQGWHSDSGVFSYLIERVKPEIIFEVGTWKGGSAINMGKYIRDHKLNCQILCIDTWLGGIEHWIQKDVKGKPWFNDLNLKNGYPSLYYQFLYNVIHSKLEDIIVPFPNTSSIVAKYLKTNDIKANLIYIDGSHDETDVYYDLINYYDVLNNNGVMFGDDYVFDSVKRSVNYPCLKAEACN